MDSCGNFVTCIATFTPAVLDALFAMVAVASGIAAMTKTPTDDKWIGKIYGFIDLLALNVGYAKDRPKSAGGRFVPE
ncbi:MAG: hypothetical protein AAF367_14165 [Pseudomonadota bacterium]